MLILLILLAVFFAMAVVLGAMDDVNAHAGWDVLFPPPTEPEREKEPRP